MADEPSTQVETQADFGTDPGAVASRWISELELAEKETVKWSKRCKKIIRLYKDQDRSENDQRRRFAILWSNVQTLGPAIYAREPQPVVAQRFRDDDPVARQAADVLERAITYSNDECDLEAILEQARDDYLLVGRGVAWERYEPHFHTVQTPVSPVGQDGNPFVAAEGVELSDDVSEYVDAAGQRYPSDQVQHADDIGLGHHIEEDVVAYEECVTDHVAWDDFLTNPARTWNEVRWVARRVFLTREELKKRFGEEIGKAVPLDWAPKGMNADDPKDEQFKKGAIWEVWDLASKCVYWISKAYNARPLDQKDDPLGLKDFFPCPKPILATVGPDSIIPVPDYVFYQDQAEELDELTGRIGKLTDALRMVGFYAGEQSNTLQEVFQEGKDNQLVPIPDWSSFASSGGVKGLLEWVPIDMVVETLRSCIETRQKILDDIYQITGISDIIRGASDPDETATAQGIKAQWGSLRVRDRQKEIARFCRDLMRIKGEIIAKKFSTDTLKQISGVKLPDQPMPQAMPALPAPQPSPQAGAPGAAGPMGQPPMPAAPLAPPAPPAPPPVTWQAVDQLLKSDPQRCFRIDIETDSTIEPNENEDKARFTEFVTAFTSFLETAGQILPTYPPAAPIFAEIGKEAARKFRVSPALEETIDKVFGQIEQMPPQGQQQKGPPPPNPMELQAKMITAQAHQTAAQAKVEDAQINAYRAQNEAQQNAAELHLQASQQQLDAAALRDRSAHVNLNLGEGVR